MIKRILLFISIITTSLVNFAQETVAKDTLTADEIIVVKPYTPTISDAFKTRENPNIENEEIKKDSIKYSIESTPVASTFTPVKGKAKSVAKDPKIYYYEDFISGGFGNYTTPYLEAFVSSSTTKANTFGIHAKYISSGGGIKDVLVDDNYSNTKLNLFYKQNAEMHSWHADLGVNHDIYNWYGLSNAINYNTNFLNTLETQQTYLNIYGNGKINFNEGITESTEIKINQFSDNNSSSEIQLNLSPKFVFPAFDEIISLPVHIDYISSNFNQNYITTDKIENSYLNIGASPSLELLRDELSLTVGIRAYYALDIANDNNAFYLYPNLNASYNVLGESLIAFAGIVGDLKQNSYREFVQENPFLSPTLNILQTDKQFNTFIGAKGKISSLLSYNFKISYQNEKNKALFVNNFSKTDGTTLPPNAYEAGNSFGIVYDNVDRFQFFVEAEVQVTEPLSIGANFEFNNNVTEFQAEAWNLPKTRGTLFAKYTLEDWFAGADIYYVGNRSDFVTPFGATTGQVVTLDSYVDANLFGGYTFNKRWSAFVKLNNVLNQNYERYTNFKVQGFQVLGGLTYKFDL